MTSRKAKVLALSIGNALSSLIGIAVSIVMARVLLKEDLAAYRQTFLAYATVAPIIGLGIGQGMFYFLPTEKLRIRGRLLDGMAVTGTMGVAFATFIAFGGNELLAQRFSNPKIANLLLWMIPYAIITTPTNFVGSVLVARDHATRAAVFGTCRHLFVGASTIIPLLIWQTVEITIVGNLVASILMAFFALRLMLNSTPADSCNPTLAGIRELVTFSMPLALAGMFGTLSLQLDKIIVSAMCPPEEFAVYSLDAIEIPLIGIVTGAITSVALTDMRKAVDAEKPQEALRLFRGIAEKSSLVILPVMVYLLINADALISILYTSVYIDSATPFRLYLLLLPIRTVVFGSIIVAAGASRFVLIRSLTGLVINLVLSILFVSAFGYSGAVLATVSTVYCWDVAANIVVISNLMDTAYRNVIPLRHMATTLISTLPFAIVSILGIHTLGDGNGPLFLSTAAFLSYTILYWRGKLYEPRQLLQYTRGLHLFR
ncbi:oligosaccharide flippase family protein [Rhodopirellula sp. JC740]|uniref:Oligosaccharide flippase family protein n=1 Tax=Rhodopirellula halodulae TaxID=2894198 RepID=A0ABS8NBF6_9BACT|nr:oligosaccharide flippase family protein [Rhodopirellula sp. JC740]MCC9640879.1 oligosaccharide flippase family protein [Rhodopirellula sp. JC740]